MESILSFTKICSYIRAYLDKYSFYNLGETNIHIKSMFRKLKNEKSYWESYSEILVNNGQYMSNKDVLRIMMATALSGSANTFRKFIDSSAVGKYYLANKGIKLAAKYSNIELVKLIYSDHKTKNELDMIHIKKAFHYSILSAKESHKIVEMFLYDDRINYYDIGTGIITASKTGNENIVYLLLEYSKLKNDIEFDFSYWAEKAFIESSINGHLSVIKLLVQLIKIKINGVIIEAFQSAFTYRRFEIINYLFSLPKTPLIQSHIQNYLATVSLHDCYNKETIENVLRNINLDPSRNSNECIRTASYYNNIILVNELLKDIRVLKNLDEKPICIAAKYGYDEIVKMFLRVPNNNWAEYAIISSLNNGYYHTSLFLLPKIKDHKEVIILSTSTYNQGIQDDKKLLVCSNPLRLTRNLSNFEIAERNKILSLIAEKII